ncbi:hypothetical protein OE7_05885 [Glaesserella parasuis gx033]|nr:hypothetical protein OE7_05885 [Glaesserella parasuis gx033]
MEKNCSQRNAECRNSDKYEFNIVHNSNFIRLKKRAGSDFGLEIPPPPLFQRGGDIKEIISNLDNVIEQIYQYSNT